MVFIKALLIGFAGVALCMADISGIVTDTGTVPISGAVVLLENGGQTVTSGPDGSFTFVVSTAIQHGNSKSLPNGFSARISSTIVTFTIVKQSAVVVTTFDLNGKLVSTVQQTMGAGRHSIALPQRGAGVYLCEMKLGNNVFVLKGNAIRGASSGSLFLSQGSSSNSLTKQAKVTTIINDVISVKKNGYLNYRVVVYNSDTTGIAIKMIASAGSMTDADGNVYQTVKLGNQEWIVENLRTTKYRDGAAIPLVTDSAAWRRINDSNFTTPAYCYFKNTNNTDTIRKFGALYNWYVIDTANTKKIAPSGWHVPSKGEWDTLQNYLIANGYNWDGTIMENKIAKSMASKTDWDEHGPQGAVGNDLRMNNKSGFSAFPAGFRGRYGDFSIGIGSSCSWWSGAGNPTDHAWRHYLNYDDFRFFRNGIEKAYGLSVRLVRD